MKIPAPGIKLIKEFEGCHLKAYPDPLTGGLPITIGWGSTRDFDYTPFKRDRVITQDYADRLLEHDILNRFLPKLSKFNTISRKLRERDWKGISATLEMYRNPGTKVEAGLRRRRIAEGKLWMS